MNKLVSKNPVLRFKLGKKIVKAAEGWIIQNGKRVYVKDPLIDQKNFKYKYKNQIVEPFGLIENGLNPALQVYKTKRQLEINRNNAAKLYWTSLGNNPELLAKSKAIFGTMSSTKEVTIPKQSSTPRSGWSYGFDRSKEGIGDIAAMQRKLKAEGYYANDEDSRDDGKWGLSTENAYIRYLNKLKAMELPPEIKQQNPIEIISLPQIYLNDFALDKSNNYSGTVERIPIIQAPYIPLGFGAKLAQAAKQYTKLAKQGGQLVSKNPIKRFKSNFRYVAQ